LERRRKRSLYFIQTGKEKMNILMVTNTYEPIIGGLEKSVKDFSSEYRARGHKVLIVTPEHKGQKPQPEVFRARAIQNFNGTDFSIELPVHPDLSQKLDIFKPDLVHSHHPYLIGDTALRIARQYKCGLVFTHHSLYELNTHYVPLDQKRLKKFVIALSVEYCNLSDQIIAPSPSIAKIIKERGVKKPVEIIPTGIRIDDFRSGDGTSFRQKHGISTESFVIGLVSRLAPEKNIDFLTQALITYLRSNEKAVFLAVGQGQSGKLLEKKFISQGLQKRLHMVGKLKGKDLTDAYHAMDVFAFASLSETQGLVLAEAFASGVPVVAVDAPGVRDVVQDKINGRLIEKGDPGAFSKALEWVSRLSRQEYDNIRAAAVKRAEDFCLEKSVEKVLSLYEKVIDRKEAQSVCDFSSWHKILSLIKAEAALARSFVKAAQEAFTQE
jgi:1,2-diacylglycerol 3-alpha-glucosyltransferase